MCPDKSILSAWFDGEVDLKWSKDISLHLKNCDSCRNYIQSLDDQKTLLHSAPLPDFEESLERVKSRIRGKRTVQSSIRLWDRRIPLPVAAAAAVIAASVTFGASFFTENETKPILMSNLTDENVNSPHVFQPGDKFDEIFSMMESSLNDEFSPNSIVVLPADVNLIFNGDSQLVRSAGFNGSASP